MVIYPYTVIPLLISEEKSIKAVESAMNSHRIIGAVASKSKDVEHIGPGDLYSIGTAAIIHKLLRLPDKGMALIVQGMVKIAIKDFLSEDPFLNASIDVIIEEPVKNRRIEALMRTATAQTQKMLSLAPYLPEEIQMTAINLDDPLKLVYLIATIVKMNLQERQEILEINSVEDKLPEEVMKEAEREVERLEKLPPASPEYNVIRTYLDWIIELPWSKGTEDNLDLDRAQKILDQDHYDLEKIKERIIEYLAVRKLKKDMKGPILCFVGPPGVGKTSLGQSIARALGRKFIR